MPKETIQMRINPEESNWKINEKNQDGTCIITNKSTGEEIRGRIIAFSSTGTFTVEYHKNTPKIM